jgi:hypothetical protein
MSRRNRAGVSEMKARRAIVVAAAALLAVAVARGGHELPVYPSYYPHEIEIRAVASDEAAGLLRAGKLHAYAGELPALAPEQRGLGHIESLGAFIVIRLHPDSPLARDDDSACALSRAVLHELSARARPPLIIHPYPVTPWHGDYLHHADLAEAARERLLREQAAAPAGLKVRAASALAPLVRSEWLTDAPDWDAAIEEINVSALVISATASTNAWLGPSFVRAGWFQAWRALGPLLRDPQKQEMEAHVARLETNDYGSAAERMNIERELVQLLASNCRAAVAGYTTRREFFNTEFSAGIENIASDTLEGLRSPIFLRTVKLKDFPWNGSLALGTEGRSDAAWNPVAGFTDPFGRLAWYAIGDPAAIPSPYDANWTFNRISDVEARP